jgi:hypothetical protein
VRLPQTPPQASFNIWLIGRPFKGARKRSLFVTGVSRALQLLLPVLAMVRITLGFRGERPVMMANVASEGRLLSLKVSEWSVLLVSVALCGLLTLFF